MSFSTRTSSSVAALYSSIYGWDCEPTLPTPRPSLVEAFICFGESLPRRVALFVVCRHVRSLDRPLHVVAASRRRVALSASHAPVVACRRRPQADFRGAQTYALRTNPLDTVMPPTRIELV